MHLPPKKNLKGMTLIEIVVSTVVVTVAAIGVLSYEYHSAKQMRMAFAQTAAVRIGYLLLEDWKSHGGSLRYANGSSGGGVSPVDLNLGFKHIEPGTYEIVVDGMPMRVKLVRPEIYCNPIPLRVILQWRKDCKKGWIAPSDPNVELNCYARVDQEGG